MEALIVALAVAALVGVLGVPKWRLGRALAQAMPRQHLDILAANIPVYRHMDAGLQQQLHRLIKQFLYQKKFIGCAGQHIDDEVRVTIAAQHGADDPLVLVQALEPDGRHTLVLHADAVPRCHAGTRPVDRTG